MARQLYIIAGCNGAGKTTASMRILPLVLRCEEFVNADEIARGLSPFHPESVAIEAGRLQLLRIRELLSRGKTFSIETTLATKSYVGLIDKAHALGYEVHLLFFWLPSAEAAIERVRHRVEEGGHDIPEDVVRRRYKAGLRNLFNLYMPAVDSWRLISNADAGSIIIAAMQRGCCEVKERELYDKIESYARG